MEPRVELAIQKFKEGYNCCQAIVCAYCDAFNLSEEDAFRIAEGFGGGMAGLGGTCGAVTGMYMVLSLATSTGNLKNPRETKMQTYQVIQQLSAAFETKNSSLICKELKGSSTGKPLRSCIGCVEDAATLLDQYFASL